MARDIPETTFGIIDDGGVRESFIDLNAQLNLWDENHQIQFGKDKEAARQYFLQHVNPNTVYFTDLEEKVQYLIDHNYYDPNVLGNYDFDFIISLLKKTYKRKYRFPTLISALKFYNQYALKTKDGKRYLERYEDRVVMNGLYLGRGDTELAEKIVDEIITNRFQPATPTFLNAGIKNRGMHISCFPAGTMVTMEGGERKPIESIAVGDRVVTHSGNTKAVYKVIENDNDRKMVTIKPSLSPAVTMTENHPVLVWREEWDDDAPINMDNNVPDDNFRWIEARDIEVGKDYVLMPRYRSAHAPAGKRCSDEVESVANSHTSPKPKKINNFQHKDGYGMLSRILGKESSSPVDKVYNLEVEDDHSYLAEGIAVHNCFLLNVSDDLESISRTVTNSLQLSKNGGGVGICLTNIREQGAPIKGIKGASSGVVPIMKILEDSFSYANQLGARQGAGAVYLSCHHPDIMRALDTKRENADEKIRIKTLSIGVVISDKAFELARNNEDMYLFSPYDVEREYGVPMTEISVTEKYDEMVDNPRIEKSKINARKFFQTVAELQFESGYPYLLFEDTANRFHYINGNRIAYSNLCLAGDTKILTSSGYERLDTLWKKHGSLEMGDKTQSDFLTVVSDSRILSGDRSANGVEAVQSTQVVRTSVNHEVMKLTTEGGRTIKGTPEHVFFVDNGKKIIEKKLSELKPGDTLLTQSGADDNSVSSTDRVISVEPCGAEDVFDIAVPQGNSFIANGIIVHNCSEILQTSELSTFDAASEYDHVGRDISCNLASVNIAKAMGSDNLGDTISTSIRALTSVTDLSDVSIVPPVKRGNELSHSVGLGAMNLHGFLGENKIHYGSKEALDFVNVFFATMRYHALNTSADIAKETGEKFYDFDKSGYAIQPGDERSEALKYYTTGVWETFPHTEKVIQIFEDSGQWFPRQDDWVRLEEKIQQHGLYHAYLLAVAPTGSISYVNFSTSSLHPVVSAVEVRKESKLGRIYSPAYGLTNDNLEYYKDAYSIGYQKVIDTYAVAQKHVDQGISSTLFFNNTNESKATTREVNRAYVYAFGRDKVKNEYGEVALYDPRTSWYSGIQKTLYYVRTKTQAIEGTEVECVSCMI